MPELSRHIVDNLNDKRLNEINELSTDSWRTMRIMAETVTAFDLLNAVTERCVSIFGSARVTPDREEYKQTVELARLLVGAGYGIITGGGPGIMEAGNRGAVEGGGTSIGLAIDLPREQGVNPYVKTLCRFRYFFTRKLMFVKYANAFVVMPGGMGTIDELTEAFVLAQTERIKPFPIILYNTAFWKGFMDWLKTSMIGSGYITASELEDSFIHMCDSPQEVLRIIKESEERDI